MRNLKKEWIAFFESLLPYEPQLGGGYKFFTIKGWLVKKVFGELMVRGALFLLRLPDYLRDLRPLGRLRKLTKRVWRVISSSLGEAWTPMLFLRRAYRERLWRSEAFIGTFFNVVLVGLGILTMYVMGPGRDHYRSLYRIERTAPATPGVNQPGDWEYDDATGHDIRIVEEISRGNWTFDEDKQQWIRIADSAR